MKNKGLVLGTAIGVGIGTAVGVALGIAIGMVALGLMKVDFNNQMTFWISTGMAVGGGASLVKFLLNSSKED